MVRGWPVCYFLLEASCKQHDFSTILKSLNSLGWALVPQLPDQRQMREPLDYLVGDEKCY